MSRKCVNCTPHGYVGGGSCEWTRLGWKRYFHHPDEWDNHHDLLRPVGDTGNTRMIANLVNLGFDITVVGVAYDWAKDYYYRKGWTTKEFHCVFDALRCILEDARLLCLGKMEESPALRMHYCDLVKIQASSHQIMTTSYHLGWESEIVVDCLNNFLTLLIDHQSIYFPYSYISKVLAKESDRLEYYGNLRASLPEREREHVGLLRMNRKKSWRLLTIDLPAAMWQTVRMRCAEKRMDDEYAKMPFPQSWSQYFDSRIKDDFSPQRIRLN